MKENLKQDFFPEANDLNKQSTISSIRKATPIFSFFLYPITNTVPASTVDLKQVFELIKSDEFQKQTKELRSLEDSFSAKLYKTRNFCFATFSGVFEMRNNKGLIQHSGLLTIDIDHINNVDEVKHKLLQDPYFETELLFTSPSGDGLKWIIGIDTNKGLNDRYFPAIQNYLHHRYAIEIDKSGKDLARACFLPYDPEVYINPIHLSNEA